MLRMKPKDLKILRENAPKSTGRNTVDLKAALSKAQDKIERLEWDNKALQLANENMKEAFLALKGEP